MKTCLCLLLAFCLLTVSSLALAEAAPTMTVTMLSPTANTYDVLEGQFFCEKVTDCTYYCMHNWYNETESRRIIDGSGYAGFQYKDGKTWTILSVWDTPGGSAVIEYSLPGAVAERFSGEGNGVHVLYPYGWKEGTWYTMRIQAWSLQDRTCYEQWVRPEGGEWECVAVISFSKPGLGFTWDCFFLEDWMGNNLSRSCEIQGYYARRSDTGKWETRPSYQISNGTGTTENCSFRKDGRHAVMIQSGGGSAKAVRIPHTVLVAQPSFPDTTDILGY